MVFVHTYDHRFQTSDLINAVIQFLAILLLKQIFDLYETSIASNTKPKYYIKGTKFHEFDFDIVMRLL